MDIAIIGGGIAGLTALHRIAKDGHAATLYEQSGVLGGLASGFRNEDWEWNLEFAYHHIFSGDKDILKLADELGIIGDTIFRRPKTATYTARGTRQLDSAKSLLMLDFIPPFDRVRTGAMLAFMKVNPFWKPLERMPASRLLPMLGGKPGWETIWEPLLRGKFGPFADTVSAAWFWARIKKRTPDLGYFRGGFAHFTESLADQARVHGGVIHQETPVDKVAYEKGKVQLMVKGKARLFDRVILAVPAPIALSLVPGFPDAYRTRISAIPHLWAQTLILETRQALLPDDIYWLNINDRSFPFLAAVDHTAFMESSKYGGNRITYFGNYLPAGHPLLGKSKEELLEHFKPFIKLLTGKKMPPIEKSFLFQTAYAQPVHETGYSKRAPTIRSPLPHIYMATMDNIVPWDRGTNYAVLLGEQAARAAMDPRS